MFSNIQVQVTNPTPVLTSLAQWLNRHPDFIKSTVQMLKGTNDPVVGAVNLDTYADNGTNRLIIKAQCNDGFEFIIKLSRGDPGGDRQHYVYSFLVNSILSGEMGREFGVFHALKPNELKTGEGLYSNSIVSGNLYSGINGLEAFKRSNQIHVTKLICDETLGVWECLGGRCIWELKPSQFMVDLDQSGKPHKAVLIDKGHFRALDDYEYSYGPKRDGKLGGEIRIAGRDVVTIIDTATHRHSLEDLHFIEKISLTELIFRGLIDHTCNIGGTEKSPIYIDPQSVRKGVAMSVHECRFIPEDQKAQLLLAIGKYDVPQSYHRIDC